MKIKRVGIIGCGAIGRSLAKFIDTQLTDKSKISALCDLDTSLAQKLSNSLKNSRPKVTDIDSLIKVSDLVIEAASAKMSYGIVNKCVLRKKDVLVMSIGGIVSKYKELFYRAKERKINIYLPSGAICGIDGLRALSLAGIEKVTLTTRKPPKALEGAEYVVKNKIDLGRIKKEAVIFEGNAMDAVKYFPQNVNVAALLSIAGIGARKTKVRIITSPEYRENSHEIKIVSKAGTIKTMSQNVPFIENPKTSYLAALSAMSLLQDVFGNVKIGS